MGVPGILGCPSVPGEGGKVGSVPVLCSSPRWAGSAPFHSPRCAVGHGTRASHPGAMTGVSPWPGSAPHGIWERDVTVPTTSRDIPEGHQRVPRHVTPSSHSQGSSPPHGSAARSQETAPQVHQQGPPRTIPQHQAPQIPTHIPFSPQTNPSQQLCRPGGTPAAGFGFQALSQLHNLVSINPEQTNGSGGGRWPWTLDPPGSPQALPRLWGHSADQHRENEGFGGLG